jgi:cytochrome bd-type quinol oxidase subunit 1
MRQYVLVAAVFSGIFVQTVSAWAVDYTGQWRGTITTSENRCKNLGKGKPGEYVLTFIQKDNEIVAMENIVKRPYRGVVNPSHPEFVHVVGSYVTTGGFVTEMVDLEFQSETAGTGKSSWQWSNDFFSCGGNFAFTLEKIQP